MSLRQEQEASAKPVGLGMCPGFLFGQRRLMCRSTRFRAQSDSSVLTVSSTAVHFSQLRFTAGVGVGRSGSSWYSRDAQTEGPNFRKKLRRKQNKNRCLWSNCQHKT